MVKRLATSTPSAVDVNGLTMHEAWTMAEPEVRAWASDAVLGEVWECGGLSSEGRCREWSGFLGSSAEQKTAGLRVHYDDRGVDIRGSDITVPAVLARAVDTAFDPVVLPDSPAAIEMATVWLESEGLLQEDTRLDSLVLRADHNNVRNCGVSGGVAYVLSFRNPQGLLCLDPYTGEVSYDDFRRR